MTAPEELVYRGMKADGSDPDLPRLGRASHALGIRECDVCFDSQGLCEALCLGMSVTPGEPESLPGHALPKVLGGSSKDPVWQIPVGAFWNHLRVFRDRREHASVQSTVAVDLNIFDDRVQSTQASWSRVDV
jgi:hypothetical protein